MRLGDATTWTTTKAAAADKKADGYREPDWLRRKATSANPKSPYFQPRQSWPEEKYKITYPKAAVPEGKHRFELFKAKARAGGSDFGGAEKAAKGKKKGNAAERKNKQQEGRKRGSDAADEPPPPSKKAKEVPLSLEERLSRPLGAKR